uniref:Uncharacterized protein n=1 Tax=Medicago truncatula TaxID=3880 RepID=I3S323_MEDTR|nr:unknown [Medicago truncatula]
MEDSTLMETKTGPTIPQVLRITLVFMLDCWGRNLIPSKDQRLRQNNLIWKLWLCMKWVTFRACTQY